MVCSFCCFSNTWNHNFYSFLLLLCLISGLSTSSKANNHLHVHLLRSLLTAMSLFNVQLNCSSKYVFVVTFITQLSWTNFNVNCEKTKPLSSSTYLTDLSLHLTFTCYCIYVLKQLKWLYCYETSLNAALSAVIGCHNYFRLATVPSQFHHVCVTGLALTPKCHL